LLKKTKHYPKKKKIVKRGQKPPKPDWYYFEYSL
jgi:hypothetical protein